jgi:hypothetical protein
MSDGSTVVYAIEDIRKIDFSDFPSSLDDVRKLSGIVKTFKLLQNYPNPFNPSTTIEYQIPEDGHVRISIFDINGKKIRQLQDGQQSSGTYKVKWRGKNSDGIPVSSGFYIYTIQFEKEVLSKRMIFLK